MPNHTRTQNDGTWVNGYTPPASDWEDLERKVYNSWNGDQGGAYLAKQAGGGTHTFAGSGLQVTGPVRLTYGGVTYGAASAYVIRNGSWPMLVEGHAGRLRKIVQPIEVFHSNRRYLWSRYHAYCGVGSVALACRTTYGRAIETADLYVPLRVVDGATITKVALTFRVATRRIYAPLGMPKLRIMRVPRDSLTTLPEPLKETDDGTGFASPTLVTTADAWYQDGEAQTFEYVCDQNTTIDVENYSYMAHLVEEVGTLDADADFDGIRFVERKTDVKYAGINSASLTGTPTIDGTVVSSSNLRVLIVDSDTNIDAGVTDSSSAKNGIWLSNSGGAWTRTTDLDDVQDFTPNWITRVTAGTINDSTCWQCEHPSNKFKVELSSAASDTATQIRMVPSRPRGNIYHVLSPTFDVSELKFQ